ncbi:AMP-binding protein [Amnibacterium kyonggiense]|uniref:Bile acid-coenzyme A ligase n=1 Tax=Amnibacterium kyonggiense TaxID=595671 RepID=A0A4R7FI86_9MICO|nr:AMP-binding protein [Amnibacterium kyonggiense]TDS75671.1 bile acid-coenzyme A ligase [Amnibacterium kyonggiense]
MTAAAAPAPAGRGASAASPETAPSRTTTPTIGEALDLLAERAPDAPAVRDEHEALTRAQLAARSRRLARHLIALGVREGDLVTVRGGNAVAFVVAVCAVHRAGGTPQPLGPRLPLEEQRAVVALAAPRAVLGASAADFPGRVVLPLDPPLEGVDDGPLPPLAAPSWKAPTSSGSTGRPKLVLAAAPARVDPDRRVAPFLPMAATQLVVGPLAHAAPFTYAFRGLTTGHALVLLPRFDPGAVLDAIARHRITWVLLVPTMLHRILRLPPERVAAADLSSIEQVVHLGAPVDPALKRRWLTLLGPERLTEVYAGTESNGVLVIRGDEWLAHPGSVGRAADGTEVRVVDPAGRPVAPGVVGRVQLRRAGGPAYRYRGAPTPPPGTWDSLGDDGRLDEDGWLFLADRGGDRIARAGTSLYPAEVERVLERHPAVRSALAVGVPDEDLERSVLAVVDVAGADQDGTALRAWANDRLDPAKRIDRIVVVHEPLRDDSGKARRRDWAGGGAPPP